MKAAYHSTLLAHHPDKQSSRDHTGPRGSFDDIGLIKTAYETLSLPALRAKYDSRRLDHATSPRPAQVVSLEDFMELEDNRGWVYSCRCSGAYVITDQDMENGRHLVGCSSCSEVVWVGYELVDEDMAGEA